MQSEIVSTSNPESAETSLSSTTDSLPPPTERNVVWRTIQFVLQNLFCVWLGYRSRGHEQLENEDGALILANHQSFLDPLLIGLPLRRPVSFVARDSLFKVPVVGWILRNTYVMPINREAASSASLRETIRRMQHGFLVGLFPEGTRTETGAVGDFKPGFVALIRRAKRPVYPVGISGAYQAMGRGSLFLKPARVRVVVGTPISVDELSQFEGRDKDEALIRLIHSRVVAAQAEAESWRLGRAVSS